MLRGYVQKLALGAAIALVASGVKAEPQVNFSADYVVTVRGLTIAKAKFTGIVAGSKFQVDGDLRSAGLARIFDSTQATSRSTGTLAQGTPQPESFLLNYAQGGTGGEKTEIKFQNGNAIHISYSPERKPANDGAIPITKSDLQSVADPVSATIVARGSAAEICNRTLRVYEGSTRIDVQLKPVSEGWIYGAGNGAVTCSGQFIPVAGFKKGNESYEYMRKSADMEFVYVPAKRQNLYLLYSISSQTEIGRVKFRAWRHNIKG